MSLEDLRSRVRENTRAIMKLAAERQKLAQQIGLLKGSLDLPITDAKVETALIQSMIDYSETVGLDKDLAERITRLLIESSKASQRQVVFAPKIQKFLRSRGIKKIGIAGAGRMGVWFAQYFEPFVESVIVYDSGGAKKLNVSKFRSASSLENLASSSDLIVVAVPIGSTAMVIDKIASSVEGKKIIIEISSVKEKIFEELPRKRIANLISIHPLFGPSADHFGENLVLTVGMSKNGSFIRGMFPQYKIVKMRTAKEHDRAMALLLNLPHTLALAFASIVSRNKGRIPRGVSTPSYNVMMELSGRLLRENPRIYYEIQSRNTHSKDILAGIKDSADEMQSMIKDEERGFGKFRRPFIQKE